jgi:type VI secretion system protein VasG
VNIRHETEEWEDLYDQLTSVCLLPESGARNIDSLLNQQILPVLSQQLLTHQARSRDLTFETGLE